MPRRRRRTDAAAVVADSHLVRSAAWAGVRAGDAVDVAGLKLRGASWTFVAHVRNTRTGSEWVEVAGGRPGSHTVRSFRPEQIFPPKGGKGPTPGHASLADAPQLPFD